MSKKRSFLRSLLAVAVVVNAFAACLPDPKNGCRTKDDCSSGRVCVVGTCQPTVGDTGLDANSDRQPPGDAAEDLPEVSSPDLASDTRPIRDSAIPATDMADEGYALTDLADKGDALVDGSDSSFLVDASGLEKQPGEDLATDPVVGDSGFAVDLNSDVVDLSPDGLVIITTDAPDSLDGLDASADRQPVMDIPNDAFEVSNLDLAPMPVG